PTTSTERQQASEEAGRLRAETRFAKLIEHISDMVLVLDGDGRVTFFNTALRRVLGYSMVEMSRLTAMELIDPDDLPRIRATVAQWSAADAARVFATRVRHRHGDWLPVEAVITNRLDDPEIRVLVVNMRDITERLHAEVELRRAQKLESVGRLAAGVAHELNTPIQFVGD